MNVKRNIMREKSGETKKERIKNFQERITQCITDECEIIRKAANPKREMHEYIKNIRWKSPELAAYLRKEMSAALNLDD